ncbi:predicted protein [Lichtheimia corymbifera JMRC:FSU:9682]|uniref:Uncharacterized protein n=1 Tax=Lichtheimia corymbifera JMRC:FSU:9682 TaxID=1263082 RepID=A0A068S5X2_9FUNG|nr:predicted protein [Lichtheimia corymbifera JMRC:FSU:9682]
MFLSGNGFFSTYCIHVHVVFSPRARLTLHLERGHHESISLAALNQACTVCQFRVLSLSCYDQSCFLQQLLLDIYCAAYPTHTAIRDIDLFQQLVYQGIETSDGITFSYVVVCIHAVECTGMVALGLACWRWSCAFRPRGSFQVIQALFLVLLLYQDLLHPLDKLARLFTHIVLRVFSTPSVISIG